MHETTMVVLGMAVLGVGWLMAWVIMVAPALLLHEAGHALAMAAAGQRTTLIRVGAGPALRARVAGTRVAVGLLPVEVGGAQIDEDAILPRSRMLVMLAGPGMSLAMALASWLLAGVMTGPQPMLHQWVSTNAIIGLAMLCPVPPLDGFRALEAWLESRGIDPWRGDRARRERVYRVCAYTLAVLAGLVVALHPPAFG